MGKQAEVLRVAQELLSDIELGRLNAAEVVLKATRLARLAGHDELAEFLALERNGYDAPGAPASAVAWARRNGRIVSEDDKATTWTPGPAATLQGSVEASKQAVDALKGGGNYSGEWASIAGREHDSTINKHAREMTRLAGIIGQTLAVVYDFTADIYHELLFSELQATLFAEVQERVDGTLAEASGSALSKIESVSARLRDGDSESISQALTTCRRLIDSTADYVFPARQEPYDLGKGEPSLVGQQQVLNRLQAFAHQLDVSKSRRDRLRVTVKELYSRCSAGTHDSVDADEARFVFLQTYVVLGEILTLGSPVPAE